MAAGVAAENGAKVILLEKKAKPGRKLLITGSGRCNITNASPGLRDFVSKYGAQGKYLHSTLDRYGPVDTMEFFTGRGLDLVVETENNDKVFPCSNRASDVLDVLVKFMAENNVTVQTGSEVKKILHEKNTITGIALSDKIIQSKNIILCTGGLSFPMTGSTGDGYQFSGKWGTKLSNLPLHSFL